MRHHPAQLEAITNKIVEKYTPQVLAKAAKLPIQRVNDRGGVGQDFVDEILSPLAIAQEGTPSYTIESENQVRVAFPLTGNLEVFADHYQGWMGGAWEFRKPDLTVLLNGDRDPSKVKTIVAEAQLAIKDALAAFSLAISNAKEKLLALANNSFVGRVRLEEALASMGIKKKVEKARDDLFGDMLDK